MPTNPTPVQVQFKLDPAKLAALQAECDRLMIGRQLVLARAVELMTRHLSGLPDPFDGATIVQERDVEPSEAPVE